VKPSGTSRALAFSIVIAGILTFFFPFVRTDPPVAGLARWSCLDIVLQVYNGLLPRPICERCGEPAVRVFFALPLTVTLEYVLLIVALLVLLSAKPAKILYGIVLFGVYLFLRGEWGIATRWGFEETFFGISRRGHVHYSGLLVVHLVVMGVLFLACLDLRDEESSRKARVADNLVVESREPQIIDAEIGRENEDAETKNPPRLHD